MTEMPNPEVEEVLARVRAEERAEDAARLAEQLETDERIVDTLARTERDE